MKRMFVMALAVVGLLGVSTALKADFGVDSHGFAEIITASDEAGESHA